MTKFFKDHILPTLGVLGTVIAVLFAWFNIDNFIEARILRILESDKIINDIAEQVRPAVVFNQDEIIISDSGAMRYIDKISVEKDDKGVPKRIVISLKKYLSTFPLLESLNEGFYIDIKRGKKFDWIYNLGQKNVLLLSSSSEPPQGQDILFRLEILK